jgi:uncharacterized protein (TIGR02301 family)
MGHKIRHKAAIFFWLDKMMIRNAIIATAIACLLTAGAAAQQTAADYRQRQADLIALSAIFGEMHHIRRSCEPRFEADAWRQRMKRLVALEAPQAVARNAMVAAFNKAYSRAQTRFPACDRRARDYAAAKAAQGDQIIIRLTEPLREAIAEDNAASFVTSGTSTPENRKDTD